MDGRGEYWVVGHPTLLRDFGSDGLGNHAASCTIRLELRHYRDGHRSALLHFSSWHQNYGTGNNYTNASELLECDTVSKMIARLEGMSTEQTAQVLDAKGILRIRTFHHGLAPLLPSVAAAPSAL